MDETIFFKCWVLGDTFQAINQAGRGAGTVAVNWELVTGSHTTLPSVSFKMLKK